MQVALYRPEIPPNTGNIGRLCHLTGTKLHIIGQPSFSLEEPAVRRAGLDYWEKLQLEKHVDWGSFRQTLTQAGSVEGRPAPVFLLFSRFAKRLYSEHSFSSADVLVFGSESLGLPQKIKQEIAAENCHHLLRIPVLASTRSLNLSNAVAIVLYEALRQLNYPGLARTVCP